MAEVKVVDKGEKRTQLAAGATGQVINYGHPDDGGNPC
jgi:hypothetical protein